MKIIEENESNYDTRFIGRYMKSTDIWTKL
jgi:hypothetical protein